ncbi:MAG TPA: hypothetical protein PKK61_02150 [Defluviitaleaceae bacterium]|nr:outer membrane lipoprotein carrier protein LolA [Candidatus Epulonipiscium sp.]HOA79851.1 hypothetical protein [Defluviitaleaceae bacterium]
MTIIKKLLLVTILIAGCFLASCSFKQEAKSPIEKIHEKFTAMDSYACIADLTYISNKGENTYKTKQYYKMTGEYRMEIIAPENLQGLTTVYDGEKVMQYNPRLLGEVVNEIPQSKTINEIFLGVFLKNYFQSEEVALEVFSSNYEDYTVLEAVIPEGGKYLSTEKLWISNNSLNPTKLVIYDEDRKERIIVEYHEFKYNVNLDESVFKINKSNSGQ